MHRDQEKNETFQPDQKKSIMKRDKLKTYQPFFFATQVAEGLLI